MSLYTALFSIAAHLSHGNHEKKQILYEKKYLPLVLCFGQVIIITYLWYSSIQDIHSNNTLDKANRPTESHKAA